MKRLGQTYRIKAPIAKVWQALTDPKVIEGWGGGPADMNDQEEFVFSLWGNEIHGTNTKVIKNKLLEQDWYSGNTWAKPSKVSFALTMDGDETVIRLDHKDIPDNEAKDIAEGWKKFYLGPLKELLEH